LHDELVRLRNRIIDQHGADSGQPDSATTGDTASSVIMGLALCIAYFAAAVMFVGALGDNRAISRRV
jgi:hypothetical protein